MIATKVFQGRGSNWEAQKAKLKAEFPKLTDADLNYSEAQKNEMLSKLELKLAMTTKELQDIIEPGSIRRY